MVSETLHIESKNRGCFHGESAVIDISLDENSANLSISHTAGRGSQIIADNKAIAPSDARHIIDRFLDILGARQRLGGDRSTTVYEGHVIWTFGATKNEWMVHSSEVTLENVKEILTSGLDDRAKHMIQESRAGYFNIAHELHRATMAVAKEHQA